jgi:TonB family protein
MKRELAGAGAGTSLSNAMICASLLLLAACAAKPPPVGSRVSEMPTSTYPVRGAGDAPLASPAVVRTGKTYRLTVSAGSGPLLAAEANVPILLPTLVAPDTIAYFELNGPGNRFFIQDLVSGQRQEAAYGYFAEAACSSELKAARDALGATPSSGWNDAQASRAAEGACRTAFIKALAKARFDAAQKALRERRFGEAKTALLAFVAAYPDDAAVAQALFSAGVADYALQNYRSAADLFHQSAAAPSASPSRAADALLAAADCALEMGSPGQSAGDLSSIVRRYPLTAAAAVANQRLAYEKKPFALQEPARDVDGARYAIDPSIVYPTLSRRLGEQGNVMLSVLVETDGSPREVGVVKGSGYQRLDDAALESVRKAYFFPARSLSGQKKAVRMQVPIRFRLDS